MIINLILQQFINVLDLFFGLLPDATHLPFGVDAMLVQGIGYFRFFVTIFPPLGTLLSAFFIYIAFILGIKVIHLIPIVRHIFD